MNQAEGGRIWPPLLCNLVCQGRTTDYVVRLEKGELGSSFYNLDEFDEGFVRSTKAEGQIDSEGDSEVIGWERLSVVTFWLIEV